MTANKSKYRGRGTDLNPPNRFERLHVDENEDNFEYRDEWEDDERKLDTIFYKDNSRMVIAKNDSPDIDFEYPLIRTAVVNMDVSTVMQDRLMNIWDSLRELILKQR